jgi:hypothetical protein
MTENELSDESNKAQPAPVIESNDPACDLRFFGAANKFAEEMIKKIPELHGVAVIPMWTPQLKDVPNGLLRLRNETPPYIAALLQMSGNVVAFNIDVQRDMLHQMRAFDQMAKDIATEVKNKVDELTALNEKIANSKEQKAQ